mgnify:CR=1 FL=1
MPDREQPLVSHLAELRRRLIIALVTWLIGFAACYHKAEWLFEQISQPVQQALPEGSSLVFIHATEPFFAYLKVAALAGFIVTLPVILWQVWMFVSPGMYKHERRMAIPFVLFSCLCFGTGTYFGFVYVFPVIFTFLINFGLAAGDVHAMLSMGAYLSMAIHLLLAFGVVFELPIVLVFLARIGLVDYQWLARQRRYAFLLGFIVGAILTPPDLFSQISIALPFILLYEIGIWGARLVGKAQVEEPEEVSHT